ncbi:MAG: AraC family transcriptional regulator [Myxococcota bacterium]
MQLPDAVPFTIWPSRLAAQAPGGRSETHAHHALHLLLARDGCLEVDLGGRAIRVPGVLTAADVSHAVDATGCVVVLAFWEPESVEGASLTRAIEDAAVDDGARLITEAERNALLERLPEVPSRRELDALTERARDALAGPLRGSRMHPRVRELLDVLRRGGVADTSLEALAAHAGLSPSHLMHVFTESVGVPLRRYLLWLKLQRAATSIVNGDELSRAAADAGFADAAHMSRTFKRMFGMTPSALQRRSRMP